MWRGKSVVVSGGMGMVGSILSEMLVEFGANVYIIDNKSRGQNWVEGAIHWLGDAASWETWDNLCYVHGVKPDAVFNLAASCGGLYFNLDNQSSQFCENMRLQSIPPQWAAANEVPIFLQVSSVCVYAEGYNSPAIEEYGHEGQPEPANEGYAWAKRMGEHICKWVFKGKPTRWVIVRPTNIFGPRDYFDDKAHVIPALIRKFLTQDKATVYGGNQTREFIFNEDVARGMLAVAEKGECGEAYNLGTNGKTKITIQRLSELIYDLTGSTADVTLDMNAETGDKGRCTNSEKAQALGWERQVSLYEGLERTIKWYKESDSLAGHLTCCTRDTSCC